MQLRVAHLVLIGIISASAFRLDGQNGPSGPAPGQLVDIGGRRMHLRCAGPRESSPTIVLLPGAGEFSSTWSLVQQLLPNERTCAYDPPGSGWSDASSVPRSLHQDAFDLHRLLQRANVRTPLVLVGHSIGGVVARIYAAQFQRVAAMILVDALHEDSTQFSTAVNRWVRVRELSTGHNVPEPAVGAAAPANPPDTFLADELQDLHDTRLRRKATLGDLPLFVIVAGKREQPPGTTDSFWAELRAERDAQGADLARLSSKGVLIRAEHSGHNVQTDEPDAVARVVMMALHAVRDRGPAPRLLLTRIARTQFGQPPLWALKNP
jgi:pimeloyl-ACP methyl ester carboxylesterase